MQIELRCVRFRCDNIPKAQMRKAKSVCARCYYIHFNIDAVCTPSKLFLVSNGGIACHMSLYQLCRISPFRSLDIHRVPLFSAFGLPFPALQPRLHGVLDRAIRQIRSQEPHDGPSPAGPLDPKMSNGTTPSFPGRTIGPLPNCCGLSYLIQPVWTIFCYFALFPRKCSFRTSPVDKWICPDFPGKHVSF